MIEASACQNTYFSTQLAIELKSTELAIALQFFINVISNHKRMGRNLIDGFTWNYCSLKELVEYFPFWTEKMIRTRIQTLVQMGILKTAKYNKAKYDQTLWYSFADEKKWGIEAIHAICPIGQIGNSIRETQETQTGRPIPSTTTPTTPSFNGVNEAASPSVTHNKKGRGSVSSFISKFTDDQLNCLEWLKSQNLNTSEETLTWWARKYSLVRLESVIREAKKRNPKSLGAYIQKLLKDEATVVAGRVELNAEYATTLKEFRNWHALEIHQKYAKIVVGNSTIEIDFNMEPQEFMDYIESKYQSYGAN